MVYPDATSGVSDLEAVTVQIQKNMSYISKIITDNGKIVAYASKLPEKPEEGVYDHAAVFKLIGV